jgi:hypothetical protein
MPERNRAGGGNAESKGSGIDVRALLDKKLAEIERYQAKIARMEACDKEEELIVSSSPHDNDGRQRTSSDSRKIHSFVSLFGSPPSSSESLDDQLLRADENLRSVQKAYNRMKSRVESNETPKEKPREKKPESMPTALPKIESGDCLFMMDM